MGLLNSSQEAMQCTVLPIRMPKNLLVFIRGQCSSCSQGQTAKANMTLRIETYCSRRFSRRMPTAIKPFTVCWPRSDAESESEVSCSAADFVTSPAACDTLLTRAWNSSDLATKSVSQFTCMQCGKNTFCQNRPSPPLSLYLLPFLSLTFACNAFFSLCCTRFALALSLSPLSLCLSLAQTETLYHAFLTEC